MVTIMANNFMNGVLIQEWWLKNLKLGFRSGYRQGFMTNATYHSFSGGVWEFMLTPANAKEREFFGVDEYPYELGLGDDPSDDFIHYSFRVNWCKINFNVSHGIGWYSNTAICNMCTRAIRTIGEFINLINFN